jgi:hypothetical protein
MSAAVPRQLLTRSKVSGIKGVNATTHTIHPVNATGNTAFNYDGNNVISFMIPAFKGGYFNPQRSFIHFKAKTPTGFFMADGCPVINRMVLRAGNGTVIEDVQSYSTIQRILSNFEGLCHKQATSSLTGDYRVERMTKDTVVGADLKQIYENGTTVSHPLLSGLLGKGQQHFIPVGLFNASGGFAFELQLYLEDPNVATLADGDTTMTEGRNDYDLTDVSLQMEVVSMPQEITEKFDRELFNDSKVSIPFTTYRLHTSFIPQNSATVDLSISESAHDLEAVYTVLRPQVVSPKTWSANAPENHVEELDNLAFRGGHTDRTKLATDVTFSDDTIKSYQFRYDTKMYPSKRAEMGARDNKLALLNAIHTLDKVGEECFASTMTAKANTIWDKGGAFCIAQSFKSTRDDYLNGLNSSATGAPLELSLDFKKSATQGLRVEHFVKSNYTLNIMKGGQTTLINGSYRKEE